MKTTSTKLKDSAAWVADHEIWPLALGVALATLTGRWADWGLGLLAALWLVRWIGRGRPTIRTPLDWTVGLMLLMVPVTFYATTDRQTTFIQISRLLAGFGLMYGLVNWARRDAHVTWLVQGIVGVGLALSLVGLVSVDWASAGKLGFIPTGLYERLPSLAPDAINANIMAGALVMLLPFPLAMLLLTRSDALPSVSGTVPGVLATIWDARWLRRLWYGIAGLFTFGVLVLTKSRGGWIAGATVIFLVLARRWPGLLWLIPLPLIGLGVLAWEGQLLTLLNWISTSGAISGWDRRVEIWSRALYMIQDFPFTGIGTGTFQAVANVLYPFFMIGPDAGIPHAHNLLLQVAVDLGLPGLVAFLAMTLLALWSALDSMRFHTQAGERARASVAWAGMTSLVGMLVHGLVNAATWIVARDAFLLWMVIGLLLVMANQTARRRASAQGGAYD